MKQLQVLNSKGEPIVLNAMEKKIATYCEQKIRNALGFEVSITTLTTIMKKITEQKFYEIPFADYLPVRVGEGAWSSNLVTYRSFNIADSFATGVLNLAGNNTRLAQGDAAVDSLSIKVRNWAKSISWTLFEIQEASKSGNWDVVTAKERARKKNWDLGLQQLAFVGLSGDSSVLGLLNQSGILTDTTTIPLPLKTMTTADLVTFSGNVLEVYRTNVAGSAWPSCFVIPESDYNGLAAPSSPDFPIKSKFEVLEQSFKLLTMNPSFKILPLRYADAKYNSSFSGLNKQVYTLLNYEEESLRMDIPVDYTNTLANSTDNFSFQNVGYGQFTGVLAYRPLELVYFTHTL